VSSLDAVAALVLLYREVDTRTAALALVHADRLVCRSGCNQCCLDDLTVFEIEAAHIRRHHADLLAAGQPYPAGACAFLDGHGACRIYRHRPYVCRSQGLPLRWLDDDDSAQPVEFRDICPLNERDSEPLETIPAEDCWTLGPFESRLARLQIRLRGAPPQRVRLRDLFRCDSDEEQPPNHDGAPARPPE
jgi:hypothetical protein